MDVDSDFSPDIRDLVVEYCKKLYGVETVANIVTKGFMAPRSAVRNVSRVLGIERDKSDYYLSLADKIAKMIPNKPNMSFAICEDELREAFKEKDGDSPETKAMKKDANEIIDQAKMVEGVFLNYGMHAAGVIIADGNPINDYIPLMRDEKSGDMKVQCNMTQAEDIHGVLKFDFLGLRNLKIVTMAIRSIKQRTGVDIYVEHLPFDPKVFKYIFASGKTGSVFQFESGGMKSMLKEAKPDCFEDLVALVSLYRPGPMDFIPKYIEQKAHPERIKYLCPELEPILNKTYGVIIYQEQVMEIVQKLAGYSLSQADNVRRYMSKKKTEKLEHERKDFIYGNPERQIEGCLARGIGETVANELFDQMIDFAKYAFNKSHAAAYAVLSYITAYLKYYYPADYMCAVLNCSPIKKIPSVLNDCREIDIEVMPPEINLSGIGFTIYKEKILFGLDSIKGTKIASVMKIMNDQNENGEYSSFKEFLRRNVADKSTAENLIKAGAMDEFNPNRHALMNNYNASATIVSKITDKEAEVKKLREVLAETPEDKKSEKKLINAEEALILLNKQFEVIRIVDTPENMKTKLKAEKEVLGFFVSAHPMDEYRTAEELGCVSISELSETGEKINIIGLIANLKITARKIDNKPMAIFTLEDKTGTIEVCCFTKAYAKFGELLEEDAIVRLTGYVNEKEIESAENDSENDEEESPEKGDVYLNFFADSVKIIQPDLNDIRITINSMMEWNKILNELRLEGYLCDSGHPLTVYDKLNGEFRKTYFYVKEDILTNKSYDAQKSA
ncbi:DNA polymerase III subunit alpha [Lacrimispora amygdalina]|uniref:DNA polymerase III subunit alpha n=1 Tax=Lacrimispora amygdalina TaxID=253257 RepID=UPI000BE44784|nr:DNA polymerase III subunit alpha [Lacrimispora amygdalina]